MKQNLNLKLLAACHYLPNKIRFGKWLLIREISGKILGWTYFKVFSK